MSSTQLQINNIIANSGNFTTLQVNGADVNTDGHTHTSSQITNFNSSVSGLLPVKDIVAGTGIAVNASSGIFTVSSTSSIRGYEILSSNKSTFTVTEGYLSDNLDVFLNGSKLLINDDYIANNGTSFTLTQTAVSGDMVEWQGINTSAVYATISHTHTASQITDFNSSVSGLLAVKSINPSGYITLSNSNGDYIIGVTGLQPSGSYALASHAHVASDISDSTSVGRSLLTAVDAAAQRTSLGLGSIATLSSGTYALLSHTHASSDITNFNSSVSGLLPVTNIVAGSNITISSSSGTYTINSTGGGSSSITGVYEYTLTSNFPVTGAVSGIYIATDSNRMYRWIDSTNKYVEMGSVGGGDTSLWNLFLPGEPTSLSGTPASGQVTLSWTAPTGVATQTPIIDYVIQYSGGGTNDWTTFNDSVSSATSGVITGLTNGSGYIFRTAAINIIGTGNYSSTSSTITPMASDPLFSQVSLLLHMEGTGSTFTDSSSNNFVITAGGNATQSTTQKKFGSKSASFTNGAISLSANNAFNFGTGDFCIEFFVYFNSVASDQRLCGGDLLDSNGNYNYAVYTTSSGRLDIYLSSTGTSWDIASGSLIGNISTGQWYHVAVVRSGGTIRTYLDGTRGSSITTSASIYTNSSNGPFFGRQGSSLFNGYIDEIRITKGSDRSYTGTTITVPTAAFLESASGSDAVFSKVQLLLHVDGANNGVVFTDNSTNTRTVTRNGSPVTVTGVKKFGTASAYFATTGDYLSLADSSSLEFGNNDFAIEMWILTTNSSQYSTLISRTPNSFSSGMWSLMMNHNSSTAGDLAFYVADINAGSPTLLGGSGLRDGLWHHIAVSRNGSTWNMYIDGSRVATATNSSTIADIAGDIFIAADQFYTRQYVGYIDDLRLTIGSARGYTGTTITVPTTEFPDS